jgi:hypothetical protein
MLRCLHDPDHMVIPGADVDETCWDKGIGTPVLTSWMVLVAVLYPRVDLCPSIFELS